MTKKTSKQETTDKQNEPSSMEELLKSIGYKLPTFKKGDLVSGTVISSKTGEVLIDVGAKSYAQIARLELETIRDFLKTLKAGDKVTGTVLLPENELGHMVISLKNLGYEKRWDMLSKKWESDEEVEVKGLEITKGGLLIEYAGIRGFIPASQLDSTSSLEPQKLKGTKIKVKILELNKKNTRFVVSQKAVTQKDVVEKQKEALEQFQIGKTYKATVTGIAAFGVFITISYKEVQIEGLIHISEIAWEKVADLKTYVKKGDVIDCVIIGIDKVTGRLNLSLKQLTADPWKEIAGKYKVEKQVKGIVSRVSSFGVFVTLDRGIEGLVHISKIPPGEDPKEGDKIDCVIEMIDTQKRKISLSLIPKGKPVGYR